jgi:hypothetical protein
MSIPIYNLIYLSTASFRFSEKDLTELLNQSRKHNLDKGITGLLLYAEGSFMQLLEGKREDIEDLMGRIKKDERHRQVQIMEEGEVARRQFPDWTMGFLDYASPQARSLPGYSTFLEVPLEVDYLAKTSARSMQLLNYFKAIMTVSPDSLVGFASAIGVYQANSGNGRATNK